MKEPADLHPRASSHAMTKDRLGFVVVLVQFFV
jgi:hypothetical protein